IRTAATSKCRRLDDLREVLPVPVLQHRLCQRLELLRADPTRAVRNLLRARDLQALALLERRDELARLEQAVVGAGIEPGIATAHDLDAELPLAQIDRIEVRDLEFATRRR